MSQAAIIAEGISKRYMAGLSPAYMTLRDSLARLWGEKSHTPGSKTFWALKDVSFEINDGDIVGLIGRNGAGKSTLLRILARVTEPTEGRAAIYGRLGSLLEVGAGFHPELTGRENIFLSGAILGMTKREIVSCFDEIVEFSELEDFIDIPVKFYSSGMYVRLGFAVAAHLSHDILLVDEALAVGDIRFQQKCMKKMDSIGSLGRTVVLVSHNMSAVERLCTRGLVLDSGRLIFSGSAQDAVREYISSLSLTGNTWERQPPYPEHPHIRKVYLCNPDGSICHEPTSASQFGFGIEFAVPKRSRDMILALAILNNVQAPLFSTASIDAEVPCPEGPGIFSTRVILPKAILMPKSYSLAVSLYDICRAHDVLYNPFTFNVIEMPSLANSLPTGRMGDLQLLCDWARMSQLA